MNKKLIAIAVASVMAAPVAMADVTVSGRLGTHLTILDEDTVADNSRGYGDNGHARIQFDATAGKAFVRMAWDARAASALNQRENYLGYDLGGVKLSAGRMATAAKNIEKDPYIATFLEIRKTVAESATATEYGSSGFVDHLAQASFKAGPANIKVQYDLGDNSASSTNEGHIAVAVAGKAGPVNYWGAYNNGTADGNNGSLTTSQSNIKLGAAMKFGAVKVSLNVTSADADTGAAGESDSILAMADMSFGKGLSGNVGFAVQDAVADAVWLRVAVAKKLSKGVTAYGGFTTTDYDAGGPNDTTEIGVGMTVKF